MSSRDRAMRHRRGRRRLLAAGLGGLAICLAGCGFRPLYGTVESGLDGSDVAISDQMASVDVAVIADRDGQQLRAFLQERLNPGGRPADPAFQLQVSLTESQGSLATTSDDTVTRANLIVIADCAMYEPENADPVLLRSYRSITSFNIQDDIFASRVSREGARERSLRDISERIRADVALYFQRES